jgi:vacuolar-type H+-ATPase subunit F/Vma7
MNQERFLLVLALPGPDTGFRLGGARTETVSDIDSMNKALEAALESDGLGIIAVPESLKDSISKQNLILLKKKVFPVIALYPQIPIAEAEGGG